ncbi:potassium channel family protein [Archaeoglobus fulgidus]|uniref:TrkA family potassium uptake protein n=2 Tax=Archaeoglobus fulgidus TaxID=2234 RepID=O29541_ARCFU|nr:NAD-binding protein [Archaeoglobus fulgidus]AAB90523.1 conserved hypothetical protein [Archaeoglobus fulgidus DSM 4304]KUJ94306.1 MAG: hypothetical protein XD40_0550 [Archaeoglobus fulgidus]KUK07581.1 MAG: hypothetical protein XD48_0235 [Archaeoglobus fulgidus]
MRVLILGYGDVGRTAARILTSRGVDTVVVDKEVHEPEGSAEFIRADVTSESFWENIELSDFDAAIIALPEDTHAIFCVLTLRRMREDLKIYVRCNESENAEKMYVAGADYVIVLPMVTAEMILSEVFGESIRRRMRFENIEIAVYEVKRGSKVVGKTLKELEGKGVKVIAAECGGRVIMDLNFTIEEGCRIALAGKTDNLLEVEAELSIPNQKD